MDDVDENYIFFNGCYNNKGFTLAGKVVFNILSPLFSKDNPLPFAWEYKLSQLLQFLYETQYTFDTSDSFYEMLATIAMQIKKNPNVDWKAVLN